MSVIAGSQAQPIPRQIAPPINLSVEALLRQLTQAMTPSVDALINQLLPLQTSAGSSLLAAAKSGIIDAVVLSNSPLTQTSSGEAAVKVIIAAGNQQYQLTSKLPLPVGAQIQLKVADNNLALLLKVIDTKPNVTAQPAAFTKNTTISGQLNVPTTRTTAAPVNNTPISTSLVQQTIEQGVRQALPQQQPLKMLLPLLQQTLLQQTPLQRTPLQSTAQQSPQSWPKELTHTINQLLKQFPTANQLQQPQSLKQAISNSGVFFEAKLAQTLTDKPAANATTRLSGTERKADISTDLKGLIQRLIPQLEKATASPLTQPSTLNSGTDELSKTFMPVYTDKPGIQPGHAASTSAGTNSSGKNLDVLLRHLGQQLIASLARTQLNQLESLAGRAQNSADNQGPVNSWNMEIPILQGKHIDNLELHIEQWEQEPGEKKQQNGQKLWTVMLNFDLHSLGKMNVQLKVTGNTVAAIVWSQLEHTHREVKQQVQQLKSSLEKIGVTVKQVDCQLGLPPKTTLPIYHQLVDVRT